MSDNEDKTNQLIDDLVQEARPVSPVRAPYMRALLWLFVAALCITIGVSIYGARDDLITAIYEPIFFLEGGALLIAGICATFATFQLSLPRDPIPIRTFVLLGISAAVLFTSKLGCLLMADAENFRVYLTSGTGVRVTLLGLGFLLIPGLILFFWLKRSAPVHLTWTMASAVIAITSFAGLGCKFICPISDPSYLFIWHYFPMLVLLAVGLTLRRKILEW